MGSAMRRATFSTSAAFSASATLGGALHRRASLLHMPDRPAAALALAGLRTPALVCAAVRHGATATANTGKPQPDVTCPSTKSTLGRLPTLPPQAVLGVIDALANAFMTQRARDAKAATEAEADLDPTVSLPIQASHAKPSSGSVGREAARRAAQALFEKAAQLADQPAGPLPAQGWVEALPFDQLWIVARACSRGRHPAARALSVNYGRRLMSATERSVQVALAEARLARKLSSGSEQSKPLLLLVLWSMRAGTAGVVSQACAPRLFGALAELALLYGLSSMHASDLQRLLYAFSKARDFLGGGPEPLSQLEVPPTDGAAWPGRSHDAGRREQHAAAAKAAGRQCRQLVLALHAELAGKAAALSPSQLAAVCWAVASNGLPAQPLLRALAAALPPATAHMTAAELSNCLWAFCCRGYLPRAAVHALVAALNRHSEQVAARGGADSSLTAGHRTQLRACDLALRLEGPWSLRPTPLLEPALLGPSDTWALGLSAGYAPVTSSALHMQVSALLTEMGTAHVNEATIPSLGCVVDVLVSESAVILEVLGTPHYAYGGTELTHSTALKLRLLRLEGWLVIELPYYEWNALGSSAHARREYLANKIVGYAPCWIDL